MGSITLPCGGNSCQRQFTFPLASLPENPQFHPNGSGVDVLTCGLCGTENRFPVMCVLPFPAKKEVLA